MKWWILWNRSILPSLLAFPPYPREMMNSVKSVNSGLSPRLSPLPPWNDLLGEIGQFWPLSSPFPPTPVKSWIRWNWSILASLLAFPPYPREMMNSVKSVNSGLSPSLSPLPPWNEEFGEMDEFWPLSSPFPPTPVKWWIRWNGWIMASLLALPLYPLKMNNSVKSVKSELSFQVVYSHKLVATILW